MSEAVRVHGLRELQRDLGKYDRDLKRELRVELKQAAEPVRTSAESMALANIGKLGPQWARMRIGVTSKLVYVAPRTRRSSGTARPNLAPMLMDRAMQPALDQHSDEVVRSLDQMLDHLGAENGF